MASSICSRSNFIFMLLALCALNGWFVTGYTFHIYDNVVGKGQSITQFKDAGISPESTVPELKSRLIVSDFWPREARAFYINGGLAKEDKQLKFFAPKGNENLVIGFVSDPAEKYIFRKGSQYVQPYKFNKKVPEAMPEAVEQSGALQYTFIIRSDVLGRRHVTEVDKTFALTRDSKIQDLENVIKDSGLWPEAAKAMYINGRCTSSFQTLESFGQKGDEKLIVDFVEDPLPLYTFLVNTGKAYELFKDPDQKFQNKLLIKGDIRTAIGPKTTMTRLKMKLKKANKWPEGKKDMIINGARTCMRKVKVDEEPCEKDLLRNYGTDGLLTIDFV
ncbi:hypothetical protein Ddc_12960 [Ditylenchus destructor]|nr:hypothetical protein Ddc_12960 [Ditylenchus destructor]